MGQYWTSTKTDMFNVIVRTTENTSNNIYRTEIGDHNSINCLCVKDRPLSSIISESTKLQEITEKIRLEEDNGNNYFNRAIEFFLLGENMYAIKDINKALEIDNNDVDFMLFKAQLLFIQNFQKHNKEIIELVETYLSKETNNPFAWHLSAKLKLYTWNNSNKLAITSDKVKKGEALANINKAVKLDPSNIEYLKLKSDLQSSGSDYSNAIATLKKALVYDSKNPDLLISMAMNKLRYYHQYNTKNNVRADKWCTLIGSCYKITPSQISKVCNYFKKAINYGGKVSPDYYSLCSQLEQAKLAEQHKPIIHTGPRGGRYTMSKSGNKVYIPRNK
jgi:tetratricopeptide (TPR) repeat protein